MEIKYLIRIVLSSLLTIFLLYYIVISINFDICKYTFCFKYINIDQILALSLSLINILIIIYGLDSWKKQTNTNRNFEIYKNLLSNLDNLEESRCCYDLLINSFKREIEQEFDPQITLLFYEQLMQKFKETRYLDITKIAQYNTYSLQMANYFPNFNYIILDESYKKYLDILESIYISLNKKNYEAFKIQIDIYSDYNLKYKQNLKDLRVLVFNKIFVT
ncbi:hypothetical protein [Acinetobacter chinensis]|uniref:hypothetical protein n=1 Tax=Acinetobacter chinensis TaxID=2004650 RepID=UPI002934399D|nr:hypothetical protein [Acinetobacter chinensis]WOE42771.1 hypothetical protein QSG87_06515 [Acinetobacter chinensis]